MSHSNCIIVMGGAVQVGQIVVSIFALQAEKILKIKSRTCSRLSSRERNQYKVVSDVSNQVRKQCSTGVFETPVADLSAFSVRRISSANRDRLENGVIPCLANREHILKVVTIER